VGNESGGLERNWKPFLNHKMLSVCLERGILF